MWFVNLLERCVTEYKVLFAHVCKVNDCFGPLARAADRHYLARTEGVVKNCIRWYLVFRTFVLCLSGRI